MPRNAGRKGSIDEARELVALASSLSEAGDALTADAVAHRLGTSRQRAEKLIDLVATATTSGGVGLPLVEDGRGEVTLITGAGVRGARLRLSRAETTALLAALDRIGVPADDPLREALGPSLPDGALDVGTVARALGGSRRGGGPALRTCSRALLRGYELRFSYARVGESAHRDRRVAPEGLRFEDDVWYLDAHDLDRREERTFRLDRMERVEAVRPAAAAPRRVAREARTVTLTFRDPALLEALPWHDLHVTDAEKDGAVAAQTPYYGGMWLPRMVAACGGAVTCDDPEVSALARGYAREQLQKQGAARS